MYEQRLKQYLPYFLKKDHLNCFEIIPGKGKVMVSAPHSVEQIRNNQVKSGEYQTGAIARILHDILDCPVIVKTRNCNDDANYDPDCDYKRALVSHIRENGIEYLLDLHQLAAGREVLINLGTAGGANLAGQDDITRKATEIFVHSGFSVSIDHPFGAFYPYTVSAYISRTCEIPCLQIEINSKLVNDQHESFNIDSVIEAIAGLIRWLEARSGTGAEK